MKYQSKVLTAGPRGAGAVSVFDLRYPRLDRDMGSLAGAWPGPLDSLTRAGMEEEGPGVTITFSAAVRKK